MKTAIPRSIFLHYVKLEEQVVSVTYKILFVLLSLTSMHTSNSRKQKEKEIFCFLFFDELLLTQLNLCILFLNLSGISCEIFKKRSVQADKRSKSS